MPVKFPQAYGRRYRHVQRVFCAALGNFETYIACVDDALVDTVDFIAYDQGIFFALFRDEIL